MGDEENYRKRKGDRDEDESDEEEISKKSKITGNSPLRNQRKLEDNIEELMKMIQSMGNTINEMST